MPNSILASQTGLCGSDQSHRTRMQDLDLQSSCQRQEDLKPKRNSFWQLLLRRSLLCILPPFCAYVFANSSLLQSQVWVSENYSSVILI